VTSAVTVDDDQDQLERLPLPLEIIQQAIWLYVRFTLSFRDVEDLLAERGILVSYETVRHWVNHFGPKIAADLRREGQSPTPSGISMRSISRSMVATCFGRRDDANFSRRPRRGFRWIVGNPA
jgi:hypothetical protein